MCTPRAPHRTLQCSPPTRRAEMLQARLTRITIVVFRLVRLARAMAHSNGRLYLAVLSPSRACALSSASGRDWRKAGPGQAHIHAGGDDRKNNSCLRWI